MGETITKIEQQQVQQDERLGLPSASSADIFMRCRGAFNLIKSLGIVKKESAAMAQGTKIHLALETHNYEGLTKSETITADRIAEKEARAYEKFDLHGAKCLREIRFWIERPFVGKLFSAKPDVMYFKDGTCVSINYKTGFSEQKDIEESWQITSELACLSRSEHWTGIKKAIGILISPNSPNLKYQEIEYTGDEVVEKAKEIEEAMVHALEADPTDESNFTAGELQCHWCPAKAACVKHAGKIDKSVVRMDSLYTEVYNSKLEEKIMAMNPTERGSLYGELTTLEGVIKKAKTLLKDLTVKREVEGYVMKTSPSVSITNIKKALEVAERFAILDQVQDIKLTDLDKEKRKEFEDTMVQEGCAVIEESTRMTKAKEDKPKKIKKEKK